MRLEGQESKGRPMCLKESKRGKDTRQHWGAGSSGTWSGWALSAAKIRGLEFYLISLISENIVKRQALSYILTSNHLNEILNLQSVNFKEETLFKHNVISKGGKKQA